MTDLPIPLPPNDSGSSPMLVRWQITLPSGNWLGAWDKEAFDEYARAILSADRGEPETVSGWIATNTNGQVLHLSKHDGWTLESVVYEPWAKPLGLVATPQPAPKKTALQQFKELGADAEETNPVERLRAFCSFAMSGQDWLDVEPFFDALATPQPDTVPTPRKLWLWRNFVNDRPEYWAFDNPFPVHMDRGDPQTLGEPCGYALFKESRDGRPGFPDSEVLRRIKESKK